MEQHDQRATTTEESELPAFPEEHKEKSCAARPYEAPRLVLIGKAIDLMTNDQLGTVYDTRNLWTYL